MSRKKQSKAEKFNNHFEEYKKKIESGDTPDILFISKLLLLANEVVSEAEDVGGPKGTVDINFIISQLGVSSGGALGAIDIHSNTANREEFMKKYKEAIESEQKARRDAAQVIAGTVVGLGTALAKIAL